MGKPILHCFVLLLFASVWAPHCACSGAPPPLFNMRPRPSPLKVAFCIEVLKAILCRRTKATGPLILERRRLRALLLCVQDLASCQRSAAALASAGSSPASESSTADADLDSIAADRLPDMESNLQLESFDFLVSLRAAIRKRLVELKRQLSQPVLVSGS